MAMERAMMPDEPGADGIVSTTQPMVFGRVRGTTTIPKSMNARAVTAPFGDFYEEEIEVLKEKARIQSEEITNIRETVESLREELSLFKKKQKDDMAAVQRQQRQMNDMHDTIAAASLQRAPARQDSSIRVDRLSSVKQSLVTTLGMQSPRPGPQPPQASSPRTPRRSGSDGELALPTAPRPSPDGQFLASPGESPREIPAGRRVQDGFEVSTAEDSARVEAAQAKMGVTCRLVVPHKGKDLLAARSGQLLSRISKETLTYISLSKKVGGALYVLYIQQLTENAQLVSAAVQCLRLLNPGLRQTADYKLILLVRKSFVEDALSTELVRIRHFGISISYSPLRSELKQEQAKLLGSEDCEMTMDGEFDKIYEILETLFEKRAFRMFQSAASTDENDIEYEDDGNDPDRMGFPGLDSSEERYMKSMALQRERDDVKLQMEQYGLTEECLQDTEQQAIYRARQNIPNTIKGRLLRFITSRSVQAASFICIVINLIVMQFEVDAEHNSTQQLVWEEVQYVITCLFVVEATINLVAFPEIFKFKEMIFDAAVVFLCWVIETINFAIQSNRSSIAWVLMLRLVRFVRFVRMIRNRGGARAVRVLTSALLGSAMNLIWITLFMLTIFYCGAIIFRSMARDAWDSMPGDIQVLITTHFRDVPTTMLTLIETFLESFDYSTVITRPLNNAKATSNLCWAWITYQLLVKLVIVNLIAGLYIEVLVRSAAQSDERSAKERYAAEHVTYKNIEAVFNIIDQRKEGCFTLNDFYLAWSLKDDVEKLVQINSAPFHGDHVSFFHFMDAQGVGELYFSDFAYGIITHRCGSKSIDKMIVEHSSKALVRQSAATKKSMDMAKKIVEESNKKLWDIDKQVIAQKSQYIRHFSVLQTRLDKLKEGLKGIFEGLDLGTSSASYGNLRSVQNVREARNIMEAMRDLRAEIMKANETAMQQAGAIQNHHALERFRHEAEMEIGRGLDILRKHEAKSINAAQTAARAARAVAHTAHQNLSPGTYYQALQPTPRIDQPTPRIEPYPDH